MRNVLYCFIYAARLNGSGGQIRHELAGEIVTNWTIAVYPDKNDILTISRNGEYKTVRVISDPEWAIKVMKTQ